MTSEVIGPGASGLVDIENVIIRKELPVEERLRDYIDQIKNPYCYLSHGIVVKLSFAGKKSFEECLKDALFARDKI